jgi:hypothetical protein
MATYEVKVIVEYQYEVEVDSPEEAEEQGWQYEDYAHFAGVYSIDVKLISEDEDAQV